MTQIIDILKYISKYEAINALEISRHFNITVNDASVRLNKLKKSGLIKIIKKGKPNIYSITNFGLRYLKYKEKNPVEKTWHGLITKKKRQYYEKI